MSPKVFLNFYERFFFDMMLVLLRFHCLKENTSNVQHFQLFIKFSILISFEIYDKNVIYLEKKIKFHYRDYKRIIV
jgi:hypothetical protein